MKTVSKPQLFAAEATEKDNLTVKQKEPLKLTTYASIESKPRTTSATFPTNQTKTQSLHQPPLKHITKNPTN
jgi:hypothetical protein